MLVSINKQDVDKLRKYADLGLGARKMLRKFSGRDNEEKNVVDQDLWTTRISNNQTKTKREDYSRENC